MRSITYLAKAKPIQTLQRVRGDDGWPLRQAYLSADSHWFPSQSSTAPLMLIGFGDTYYRITAKTCQLRNFCATRHMAWLSCGHWKRCLPLVLLDGGVACHKLVAAKRNWRSTHFCLSAPRLSATA